MSKPLPFARVPATRPSGFWITLKTTTAPSRILSTSGSVPYGVVARRSMMRMFESTPSYSLPWMAPWMKSGTLTSSPNVASCGLRPRRLGQHARAEVRPAEEGLLLRARLELVDDDLVERASGGRLAGDLDRHPAVLAARLDVVQGALDRVDGDVREAGAGRRQVRRRVGLGRAAPRRPDGGRGGTRCRSGREHDERQREPAQESANHREPPVSGGRNGICSTHRSHGCWADPGRVLASSSNSF